MSAKVPDIVDWQVGQRVAGRQFADAMLGLGMSVFDSGSMPLSPEWVYDSIMLYTDFRVIELMAMSGAGKGTRATQDMKCLG